jgi:hypothetical protein
LSQASKCAWLVDRIGVSGLEFVKNRQDSDKLTEKNGPHEECETGVLDYNTDSNFQLRALQKFYLAVEIFKFANHDIDFARSNRSERKLCARNSFESLGLASFFVAQEFAAARGAGSLSGSVPNESGSAGGTAPQYRFDQPG